MTGREFSSSVTVSSLARSIANACPCLDQFDTCHTSAQSRRVSSYVPWRANLRRAALIDTGRIDGHHQPSAGHPAENVSNFLAELRCAGTVTGIVTVLPTPARETDSDAAG